MPRTDSGPRIAFLLTGEINHNSRAIRQIRALSQHGLSVHALTLKPHAQDQQNRRSLTLSQQTSTDSTHVLPTGPADVTAEITEIRAPRSSGPSFFWHWHKQLLRHVDKMEADIVHASDLYALPAASKTARKHKSKCTYDARELYSHVASTVGRPWISAFWKWLEQRHIVGCDAVFTVSDSIADYLSQTHGSPRPIVIQNVPDLRQTPNVHDHHSNLRHLLGLTDADTIILHQGQVRKYRGCETLVRAAAKVDSRSHFVFLGHGDLIHHLTSLAAELHVLDRVHFVDSVPPNLLLAITRQADIGVTLLEDVCLNHRFALPNKLFEYLAAGVPVLGSDLPEIRRIIQRFDVGLLCNPGDPADTATQIDRMASDASARDRWRRNSSKVFETINWESASHRFVTAFLDLV